MKFVLTKQAIDHIADELASKGYILVSDFLSTELASKLLIEAQTLCNERFKPAGIGRKTTKQLNAQVRTDSTLWLDGASANQAHYLASMEQLRIGLNRRLFMGLFDFECHFSHYKQGDFYKTHLDAFTGQSNRILSTVYYLNHQWSKDDGGQLVLYDDAENMVIEEVLPSFNQCIIFLSDKFPHEVQVSRKDRFSIAGWFRVNASR